MFLSDPQRAHKFTLLGPQSTVSSIAGTMDSTAFVSYYLVQLNPDFYDQIIPRSVIERACGFAIFTIFKAGFLFSARGGGGIVLARLDDGCKLFISSPL